MKFYNEKMQTVLTPKSAIALLKIYGADYFTQINILDGFDISKTLAKDIKPRNVLQGERLKKVCNLIRKVEKTRYIQVELLKKQTDMLRTCYKINPFEIKIESLNPRCFRDKKGEEISKDSYFKKLVKRFKRGK